MNAKRLIESAYQPTELEMEYAIFMHRRGYEVDFYGPGLFSVESEDGLTVSYHRVINRKEWPGGANNHERHRENGPALVFRGDSEVSGKVSGEEWFVNGVLHRENGPAVTRTDRNGTVKRWYSYGVLHRKDGPAVINDGYSLIDAVEEWFVNGVAIKKRYRDGEWWFRS